MDSEIAKVLLLALLAGGAIPLGGWLARIEKIHPAWLETEFRHGVIAFASGAILYIVFGDVAPQAKLKKVWMPPLGAVFGFLLGLVGQMLLV